MTYAKRQDYLSYPLAPSDLATVVARSLFLTGPSGDARPAASLREGPGCRIWERRRRLAVPQREAVICIGAFDGLHMGHRMLAQETMEEARARGCLAVAVTFDPLPSEYFRSGLASHRLLSAEERARALMSLGLDAVVMMSFDRTLAETSYQDYLLRVLPSLLAVTSIHVGANFCLGKGGLGTARRLKDLGASHGISLHAHQMVQEDGRRVSATRIRDLVHQGRVGEAARLLGRLHWVSGMVEHGRGEGGSFGFPTANVRVDRMRCLPEQGVYAGLVACQGRAWPAAINVGAPPTFSGPDPSFLEANLLGFTGDLYGKEVQVLFASWLRDSRPFDSLEELEATVLGNIGWVRRNLGDRGVDLGLGAAPGERGEATGEVCP